jgi:hypothetical protein
MMGIHAVHYLYSTTRTMLQSDADQTYQACCYHNRIPQTLAAIRMLLILRRYMAAPSQIRDQI